MKTYAGLKREIMGNAIPKATGLLTKDEMRRIEIAAARDAMLELMQMYEQIALEVDAAMSDYKKLCKRPEL